MSTSIVEKNVYQGAAEIVFQDGKSDPCEVRLWSVERITDRPVLGQQRILPREDVLGVEGEILTPLPPPKLQTFAFAQQLHLQYGGHRWKISFGSSGSPRFKAWGHSVDKQP